MQRLTDSYPGSGGELLSNPEDFRVDEFLPYPLSGQGSHLFIHLRKIRLDTIWASTHIARSLGVISERARLPPEAGIAGLKDRHAETTQWMSLPWPEDRPLPEPGPITSTAMAERGEYLEILASTRHGHKLRKGHVANNRFTITLRNVPLGGFERASATWDRLKVTGVPNFYGPQRFGANGQNPHQARLILSGNAPRPRDKRLWSLLLSSLQSEVFNQLAETRIRTGLFTTALEGDRMVKHATGGQFNVEDPSAEQPRVNCLEISPTGALPGKKPPRGATKLARELEEEAQRACKLDEAWISRLGAGARRPLRFPLDPNATLIQVDGDHKAETFQAQFTLPSGAYATVLLDELIKPDNGPFNRSMPNGSRAATEPK